MFQFTEQHIKHCSMNCPDLEEVTPLKFATSYHHKR